MLAVAALVGCQSPPAGRDKGSEPMKIHLSSVAFVDGQPIPTRYTGEGDDFSPPLRWLGAPVRTQQYVLICDDPDAPRDEPWVHWVIYNIPPTEDSLPAGVERTARPSIPAGARQGVNSSGQVGYWGPMPPVGHGTHHYHFRLYALDTELDLAAGLNKEAVLGAIAGHVIGEGELVGTYERKRTATKIPTQR